MTEIDIGSLVRIAGEESRALYIVDGVVGCDFRLLDKAGGWSLMDRSSVVLADDQDVTAPSDSPDDQFTGEDLGAAMAAAERDVNEPVTCRACEHCARINEDVPAPPMRRPSVDGMNDEVGNCMVLAQFRALDFSRICSDFAPRPPRTVSGYRVGDAHEGGEV